MIRTFGWLSLNPVHRYPMKRQIAPSGLKIRPNLTLAAPATSFL